MFSKNSKNNISVFVTGAGCAVGQAILKSLNVSKYELNIFVGDISKTSIEFYLKNKILIPKVEQKNSLKWFINFLKKKKIDILFVGSEFEIDFFSKHKKEIEKKTNTIVCVSDYKIIKLFNNKLSTIEFLEKNNFNHPRTFAIKKNIKNKNDIKLKFPFYLKDTHGTSSKNVFLINSFQELRENIKKIKNPLIQETLGKKYDVNKFHDEFTCSVFYKKNGQILGPFLSERILKHGTSWVLRTVKNDNLKKYIVSVSKKIKGTGSVNFQLKRHKKKFYIFEINPRFSGTTFSRAIFNFNEPEMFIENYFFNKMINKVNYKQGSSYRYFEDIFIIKNSKEKTEFNQNSNLLQSKK